jgi:hypothetical protein
LGEKPIGASAVPGPEKVAGIDTKEALREGGLGGERDFEYRREYMNTSAILALVFVLLSLISLLSVSPTWDTSVSQLSDNPSRISEAGLRTKMQR